MMLLIATVIFGSMVMYSCTTEDDENENGGEDGGDTPSQIQGPKWVLVDVLAPDITEEDIRMANNSISVYKVDSVKVVAKKQASVATMASRLMSVVAHGLEDITCSVLKSPKYLRSLRAVAK